MRGTPTSHDDPDRPGPTPGRSSSGDGHRPTTNEIPGTVAVDVALARTDDLVVAIIGMHAYSTGLAFDLAIRQRTPAPPGHRPGLLHEAVAGFGAAAGRDVLLLGFGYPDGRTATNLRWGSRQSFDVTDQPQLLPGGGGGNGQTYDGNFFLSPLPTGGDLTVVCAWPSRGIAETQTRIPAQLITDATTRIVELWPWEDLPDEPPSHLRHLYPIYRPGAGSQPPSHASDPPPPNNQDRPARSTRTLPSHLAFRGAVAKRPTTSPGREHRWGAGEAAGRACHRSYSHQASGKLAGARYRSARSEGLAATEYASAWTPSRSARFAASRTAATLASKTQLRSRRPALSTPDKGTPRRRDIPPAEETSPTAFPRQAEVVEPGDGRRHGWRLP